MTISRCSVTTSPPLRDRCRHAQALNARGLTSMEDRQLAVEGATGRAVRTLRDLTHDEAIRVLNRLGEAPRGADRSTSLWESRDEDTWIDRL